MNRKNSFFNFMCALIPGVGYMYNGLMKRGVEQIILFFGIFSISQYIQLDVLILPLLIPIWFYNFFDTFNVKNAMERGIFVDDNYRIIQRNSSELSMSKINNKIIGIALIIIGALAVVNKVWDMLFSFRIIQHYHMIYSAVRQLIVPVILIVIGFVLMGRNKHNKIDTKNEEPTVVLDKE
ncbi:hypothetical protein [Clostridium cellulovorans]|uniref:Membrane protein n=1 Tax=Clostridium cellulovorans (strain ATCC 35296 / DSM 3052 / OCM 3 / 743B) TaxID=573061 RepID=D9SXD9_CLOC7|nr:hypothetical protein [Clostridium cellulovorans]ADL53442.1 membrane protein [Clostridium cellulovorans 743B]